LPSLASGIARRLPEFGSAFQVAVVTGRRGGKAAWGTFQLSSQPVSLPVGDDAGLVTN
jgi:hypothetical protein